MLNFAIIGFGGLGKSHYRNVSEVAAKVKDINLVAICDVDEASFHTQTATNLGAVNDNLDLSAYHLYTDVEELLDKEQLDFVITAIPTYVHEKVAVMAMERGLHVFSEKPMAINKEQAENMLAAARKNNVKLMIGQCLRYWPEYVILKEIIESKKYGNVINADFARISATPLWSWQNWMMDEEKSGGAALDMHVHDVDFINWAFGAPKAVTSVATHFKCPYDSITTVYDYDDMFVTATGDWGMPADFPFSGSFIVKFEKATVTLNADGMKVYHEDGGIEQLEIPAGDAYVNEIVDFVTCIRENKEININHPESSCQSLKIALAEKESARTGEKVVLS